MIARFFVILAAGIMVAAGHAVAQPKTAQSAVTTDITIGCPKDADFDRYATLLLDDVSAAILFKNDHGCVSLPPNTFVRIDKGSVQRDASHVCIRPVGMYDCLWTFAAHIKVDAVAR